ncbi:MAG: hypothetical protein AVDCRST_MAG69-1167, partial [uncultured Solirubrobacteraceae bacterium]
DRLPRRQAQGDRRPPHRASSAGRRVSSTRGRRAGALWAGRAERGKEPTPGSPCRRVVAEAELRRTARAPEGWRHALQPGARTGESPTRHHHSRAGRDDGHQAELPLSRDAEPGRAGAGAQVRS